MLSPNIKLVIFDADGTLTPQRNGSTGEAILELLPGRISAIEALIEKGIHVAVASNQSARRSKAEVATQMAWTSVATGIPAEVMLVAVDKGLQKPSPAMIKVLADKFEVKPEEVLLVGDQDTDRQAILTFGGWFEWEHEFFEPYYGIMPIRHVSEGASWLAGCRECIMVDLADNTQVRSLMSKMDDDAVDRLIAKMARCGFVGVKVARTLRSTVFTLPQCERVIAAVGKGVDVVYYESGNLVVGKDGACGETAVVALPAYGTMYVTPEFMRLYDTGDLVTRDIVSEVVNAVVEFGSLIKTVTATYGLAVAGKADFSMEEHEA